MKNKKCLFIIFILCIFCIACFSSCEREEANLDLDSKNETKRGDESIELDYSDEEEINEASQSSGRYLKCKTFPLPYDDGTAPLNNILITENNTVYVEWYDYRDFYESAHTQYEKLERKYREAIKRSIEDYKEWKKYCEENEMDLETYVEYKNKIQQYYEGWIKYYKTESKKYEEGNVIWEAYLRFKGTINFSSDNKTAELKLDSDNGGLRCEISGDGAEKYRNEMFKGCSEEEIIKLSNGEYISYSDNRLKGDWRINIKVNWDREEFEVSKMTFPDSAAYFDGGCVPVRQEHNGKIIAYYETEYYESGYPKTIREYDSDRNLIDTREYEDGDYKGEW